MRLQSGVYGALNPLSLRQNPIENCRSHIRRTSRRTHNKQPQIHTGNPLHTAGITRRQNIAADKGKNADAQKRPDQFVTPVRPFHPGSNNMKLRHNRKSIATANDAEPIVTQHAIVVILLTNGAPLFKGNFLFELAKLNPFLNFFV